MTDLEKFVWEKGGSPSRKEWSDAIGWVDVPVEITLAHVLNALRLKEDEYELVYEDTISFYHDHNNIWCISSWDGESQICILWDILEDFSGQSLETQQAIAKLLGWEG